MLLTKHPKPLAKLNKPTRKVPIKLKQLLMEPPLKVTPPLNLKVKKQMLKLMMLPKLLIKLPTKPLKPLRMPSNEIF